MKLAALLLTLILMTARVQNGEGQSTNEVTSQDLLKRAALQLERLSGFQRTRESQPSTRISEVSAENDVSKANLKEAQTKENILEAQRRIDDLRASAQAVLRDPRYADIMQDRIKRSFISGIANKLIGGAVGAASGLSRGVVGLSSSNTPAGYGSYGHSYESQFDIWDFKKAIINTLIQAIKAIGGGAIAGGGALVKGGGYLVSAKGRFISSAGEAISSLGKSLASSAIIAGPKPVYGPPGYSYDQPAPHSGHAAIYDGPPPSEDAYAGPEDAYNAGHSSYTSPSNDDSGDNDAGILVVNETIPGHGQAQEDEHPPPAAIHETNPSLSALEESFGGPTKESSTVTKIIGILNSGQPTGSQHQEEHVNYYSEHKDHQSPPSGPSLGSTYETVPPLITHDIPQTNNYQNYQGNGQIYDSYGNQLKPSSPQLSEPHTEGHQPNQDNHQSLALQIQAVLNPHLEVPKAQGATTFKDPASFADYHYHGNQHLSEPLKIPILDSNNNHLDHHSQEHQQIGTLNYYETPNYGGGSAQAFNTMIGIHADASSIPTLPYYDAYQMSSPTGFTNHGHLPAPGGPAVLGVWGRMTRRTSQPGRKTGFRDKRLEIQRSVGYTLKNSMLTRI